MKSLFTMFAAVCLTFVFAANSFARDPALDLLISKGLVSEDEVAAAEAKAKKPVMQKSDSIELGGYIQTRYSAYDDEAGKNDDFSVKRARMKLKGYVVPQWFFDLEYDFASSSLKTAFITFEAHPMANITVGEFKEPYAYGNLISSSKIDTIDRAIVLDNLAHEYDIGAMVSGKVYEGMFEYAAAVMNGAGPNTPDDNDKKDFIGRVAAYPLHGSEGKLALMVAGAYMTGEQPNIVTGVDPATGLEVEIDLGDQSRNSYVGTVEARFDKAKVVGEYLHQELEDIDITSDGYYVLGTYDVVLGEMVLQPVVMYDTLDGDTDIDDEEINTTTVGVNLFPRKNVKLSVNYKSIDETPNKDNNQILGQAQIIF